MASEPVLVFLACFVVALGLYLVRKRKRRTAIALGNLEKDAEGYTDHPPNFLDEYPPVQPRHDFDWSTTDPIKLRGFKPLYHLTMGVTNIDISSIIEMDRNYVHRLNIRRKLMAENRDEVLAAHPSVKPAVDEFYVWLLSTYLPTRYPSMFTLRRAPLESEGSAARTESSSTDKDSYTHLWNSVMQEAYPLNPPSESAVETLRTIGSIIDEDCQFLLPSDDGDGYILRGLVCCFPNGFGMAQKLNLKLRDIHIPVPHYKEKLEKSLDRFFGRLEVGRVVRRANWTVSTTPDLFNPAGNHLYENEEIPDDADVDVTEAVFRSELQSLHRLPRTRALLFMFKTYTYPLQELKDEGHGEDLAQAIDGMRDGSAPGIHRYKKAVVWGEKVKKFLRS